MSGKRPSSSLNGAKVDGLFQTAYDVALTGSLPRPIVAAAIACHVDSREAPFGRFSTVLRAYTVNR